MCDCIIHFNQSTIRGLWHGHLVFFWEIEMPTIFFTKSILSNQTLCKAVALLVAKLVCRNASFVCQNSIGKNKNQAYAQKLIIWKYFLNISLGSLYDTFIYNISSNSLLPFASTSYNLMQHQLDSSSLHRLVWLFSKLNASFEVSINFYLLKHFLEHLCTNLYCNWCHMNPKWSLKPHCCRGT